MTNMINVRTSHRGMKKIDLDLWTCVADTVGSDLGTTDFDDFTLEQWDLIEAGLISTHRITVYRHVDGRFLVVAERTFSNDYAHKDQYEGEFFAADEDMVVSVRCVGADCGISDDVIEKCVLELPSVEEL